MPYYKVMRGMHSVIAKDKFCVAYEPGKYILAPMDRYGLMIFDNIENSIAYVKNIKSKNDDDITLWECDATNVVSIEGMDANDREFVHTLDSNWDAETTFPIGTCSCTSVYLTRKINLELMDV